MKKTLLFLLVVITTFLFSGCTLIEQETYQKQNTPKPTLIPTILIPSLESTDINQDTIISLEPENIQKTSQPFFQDPMNCATPCFWGIIPGITTMEEVINFFTPLGFEHREGNDLYTGKSYYSFGYEDNIGLDTSIIIYIMDDLAESIEISPDISNQSTKIPREWIAYSPETLIKKFGQPSRVQFALYWGPNMYNTIAMIMYFDDLDFIALYSGDNMIPGNPYSPNLCPLSTPFDSIRFWMGKNPLNPPTFETVPLEEATSLTIEQFTNLMLGDPESACFTLNGDAFE